MSYDHPTKGYRVVDAKFYAQVEPRGIRTRWDSQQKKNVPTVDGAAVVNITQSRPSKPKSGCVVVELTLRVPENVFLPLQPTAIIDLPDTMTAVSALIEVEAEDANDQGVLDYLAQQAGGS
jgi:hypothetical protein